MTKPPRSKYAVIVKPSALTRRALQGGPGGPTNERNAAQRAWCNDRKAAGQLGPNPASFVNHKEATLLSPHSLFSSPIGSVTTHLDLGGLV